MTIKIIDINKPSKPKFSEEQRKAFESAARPLLRYLNDNHHPHMTAIVTQTTAELVEGQMAFMTEEYIKD